MTSPTLRLGIGGTSEFVAREIEAYGASIARFRGGLIPDAVFLETRLRFGIYGQRQDGVHMVRSKLPLGLLAAEQLEAFADIAQTFGNGVAHLTTRQDIQLHFVVLEKTPEVLHVLSRAEVTSREACGNVVRNVTASVTAGISEREPFDVTPYGMALARYLLRHPDGQNLGRKFKVNIASDDSPETDTAAFHDLGAIARMRDGKRGFEVFVGGGLGPVPHESQLLSKFLPEEELIPTVVAILRVFGRHGEKKNRARARVKFLVADWGIDRFVTEVTTERSLLVDDPQWRSFIGELHAWDDRPIHPPGQIWPTARSSEEAQWLCTNVVRQKQPGYAAIRIRVPRGDLNPSELRGLSALLREHSGDTLRITVDQGLLLRFIPFERILSVHDDLVAMGLGAARAGGLGDTVTCPGADTCKLGITTPRSVARQMQEKLDRLARETRLEKLRVHVSGCPNSCAQQQIADIGFFGAARTVYGVTSPHYMLVLGGLAGGRGGEQLGSGFGTTITKLPAFRVGEAVERLANLFLAEGLPDEPFGLFTKRLGRQRFKDVLEDLNEMPPPDAAPEAYCEFGKENTAFAIRRGTGECAGEVVEMSDLLLIDADREADAAVAHLEAGRSAEATGAAHEAFDIAARALLSTEGLANPREFDTVAEFRRRFYESGRIFEGVGHYYLQATSETEVVGDRLRRLVVEAGLFVEEVHAMIGRLRSQPSPKVSS